MTHVTKETAQLLKEKGFDLPCLAWYIVDDNVMRSTTDYEEDTNGRIPNAFTAPDIYQASIWLREAKGVHVYVTCTYGEWDFSIENAVNGESLHDTYYTFKTHDLSLEAGIIHALKHYVK